jgi:hypothetical protein
MRNSRSFATLPCLYGPMLLFEGATLATLCSVTQTQALARVGVLLRSS